MYTLTSPAGSRAHNGRLFRLFHRISPPLNAPTVLSNIEQICTSPRAEKSARFPLSQLCDFNGVSMRARTKHKKKTAHVNVFKYLKAPLAPLETHIGGRVLSIQARWKFRRQKRLMPTFSCVICYCILIRSHKAHRCK